MCKASGFILNAVSIAVIPRGHSPQFVDVNCSINTFLLGGFTIYAVMTFAVSFTLYSSGLFSLMLSHHTESLYLFDFFGLQIAVFNCNGAPGAKRLKNSINNGIIFRSQA